LKSFELSMVLSRASEKQIAADWAVGEADDQADSAKLGSTPPVSYSADTSS
jgi:hypothetical protein